MGKLFEFGISRGVDRGKFKVVALNSGVREGENHISTDNGDVQMFEGETKDLADNWVAIGILGFLRKINPFGGILILNADDYYDETGEEPE